MWIGAYEPRLVAFLKYFLKPGMVFLDIGANIGFFSAIAAGLVGTTGRVYAFEPNPSCLSLLEQNLLAFPWAVVCPVAVGDEAARAIFYQSNRADEDGWGSLFCNGRSCSTIDVQVVRIDDWCRRRSIQQVDFVKMDIEGGEYRALTGAKNLFNRSHPVIVGEMNPECLRRDRRGPDDVVKLLRDLNYDVFAFDDDNFVAVHREADPIRLRRFLGKPVRL